MNIKMRSSNKSFKLSLPAFLIVLIGIVSMIKYFITPLPLHTNDILIAFFKFCFFVSLGLVVNKGYKWAKYIVLVLAVLGLMSITGINNHSTVWLIISLTFILQRVLFVVAAILLFKPFKARPGSGN